MNKVSLLDSFLHKVTASLGDNTFVRLSLSSPGQKESAQKVLGRGVTIKAAQHLSLTFRHATRDVTKNILLGEVEAWLRTQLTQDYRGALLGTTARDWQFSRDSSGRERLIEHQPVVQRTPAQSHDQKHPGILDATAHDWLQGLDILDRAGKVRASMADKHRQINHYLEIVSHLAKECGWQEQSNQGSPRHLVDMGCGKGYLTFGLWHLFTRTWKQVVRVTGVETRSELVTTTNSIAHQCRAAGLEFVAGDISVVKLDRVDALIALHACNTATDEAIRRGIELNAQLIIVAPCCHKEVRPQLGKPEPLAGVLRHGIMAERMAEWTTDGLRTLFLEWAGYRTKAMEFVSGEHTPKNLMIAAVRERAAFSDPEARRRIEMLKEFFGIQYHSLDGLLAGKPNQG